MSEKPYWPPYRRPDEPAQREDREVDRGEIAQILGVKRDTVDKMALEPGFPAPVGRRYTPRAHKCGIMTYSLSEVLDYRRPKHE